VMFTTKYLDVSIEKIGRQIQKSNTK